MMITVRDFGNHALFARPEGVGAHLMGWKVLYRRLTLVGPSRLSCACLLCYSLVVV